MNYVSSKVNGKNIEKELINKINDRQLADLFTKIINAIRLVDIEDKGEITGISMVYMKHNWQFF